MENTRPAADDGLIFVLDIGTRSVVGIAGRGQGNLFQVEASVAVPHSRRAMIDGQIEDIEQVALIAGQIKDEIEAKLGVTFRRVGVAAAGRALKTNRAVASAQMPEGVPIGAKDVFALENEAVNAARRQLDEAHEDIPYYCAGYSVVRYTLDGYPFSTIQDHRGGLAEVEIIATFLPTEVVSSLRRCMELLDLEVDTMTLEPIAAMRAVIPQDLRLLNLALVDIGAGTSDIAISANGTVAGFTMATVAGDEITEAIIREHLVSFAVAEEMKLAACGDEPIVYTDILGFEHTLAPEVLQKTMQPAVDTLAQVICDKILECNAGAPAAVFLVGGGSKTAGLCEKIAEILGLDTKRVALAGTQFSGKVLNEDAGLDDPEYATPVGIALTALDNARNEGAAVTINNQRVRLFNQGATSVMDALLLGGYGYSDLMGRNGRPLTFTLNGERTVLRGGPYSTAEVSVNGAPASLSAAVESGDSIGLVVATSGEDATATVANYAEGNTPLAVTLNGRPLAAGLIALVNGAMVPADTPIFEGDAVEIYFVRTVAELCEVANTAVDAGTPITVNGASAGPDYLLADGDAVVLQAKGQAVAPAEATEPTAPPSVPTPAPVAEPAPVAAEPPTAEEAPETPPVAETAAVAEAAPPVATRLPGMAFAPLAAEPVEETAATVETPPQASAAESPASAAPAAVAAPEPAAEPAPEPAAAAKPEPPAAPSPVANLEPVAEPEPVPAAADTAPPPSANEPQPGTPAATDEPPLPRRQSLRIELNGRTVVLPPKPDAAAYQLFDMFALVDIDPTRPQGNVKVLVNGENKSFLDEIVSGDSVEIGWEG